MSESKWFETWFDSDYYHTLYKHRDDNEAKLFIDNLVDHLNLNSSATILDLACGKGRHSIYLHSKGFNVTGADLSANSIASAKNFETAGLRFKVHDMRQPLAHEEFDVVLNLFTSFGYFDDEYDNKRVLQSIYTALKPGGTVVIDFMNVTKVIKSLVETEEKKIDGINFGIERSYDGAHIYKRITVDDDGTETRYMERVQAITDDHLSNLMQEAGFHSIDLKGNYDLAPFNSQTSDRLIAIARKPK